MLKVSSPIHRRSIPYCLWAPRPALQMFLGMVQFLSCFVPNLPSIAASLWALTKKTSEFVWSPEHQSAVDRIKRAIAAPTSLQYFDSTQPVTIQVDTSQRGLGAVPLQANGPVEFASKLLTPPESHYSNIERGMSPVWLREVPLLCL